MSDRTQEYSAIRKVGNLAIIIGCFRHSHDLLLLGGVLVLYGLIFGMEWRTSKKEPAHQPQPVKR